MKPFTDSEGRQWPLSVNVAAVKRVRDLCGVDLLTAVKGELLEQLSDDPVLLCDVLFALVKPTADERGISDEQFGSALGGDVLDAATVAFLEELVDFFPKGRRAVLRKALARIEELHEKAHAAAERALDSPKMDAAITKALEQAETDAAAEIERRLTSGATSTSSPAASGSTPDR